MDKQTDDLITICHGGPFSPGYKLGVYSSVGYNDKWIFKQEHFHLPSNFSSFSFDGDSKPENDMINIL